MQKPEEILRPPWIHSVYVCKVYHDKKEDVTLAPPNQDWAVR